MCPVFGKDGERKLTCPGVVIPTVLAPILDELLDLLARLARPEVILALQASDQGRPVKARDQSLDLTLLPYLPEIPGTLFFFFFFFV